MHLGYFTFSATRQSTEIDRLEVISYARQILYLVKACSMCRPYKFPVLVTAQQSGLDKIVRSLPEFHLCTILCGTSLSVEHN